MSSSPGHCPASSETGGRRPHAGGKYQKGDRKDDDIIMSSLNGRPAYPSELEVWKASWENWRSLTISRRKSREKSISVDFFLYVYQNKENM
jgi:hypothetical protein